jgi:asparagine synthase (glutamine-hydrolysing)
MTAIAGLWHFDNRPDATVQIGRMLAAQAVYGPHHGAQWVEGPLALGRRLYRLLPEDVHDRGPVRSPGGNLVGVMDGRLDNRDELLRSLSIPGRQAATTCDTALLVAAFDRWGDAALDRLCGDFACPLWDRRDRRLLLARDCLGNRPLHYHRGANFFAFATMPKGLHALAEITRVPDCDYAAEYMALLREYGERTFFAGMSSVQPGHLLTVSGSALSIRRYWHPPIPEQRSKSRDYYLEGVRHHLDEAVRARLRGAAGQVASQLSGGLDSTAVTATAARSLAPEGGTVTAFTAVPRSDYVTPSPDRLTDEGALAAATAGLYPNLDHVLVPGEGRSPFDALERSFFLFERPIFGLVNLTWVSAICREARRRGLTIMLTGDMGNATLSYSGLELLPALLRSGRWPKLFRELSELVRHGYYRRRGALALAAAPLLPSPLWRAIIRLRGAAPDLINYAPLAEERIKALHLQHRARRFWAGLSAEVAVRQRMLAVNDLGNFRKGYLAGWGIDKRDPTADRRLVEFCLSAPLDQFLVDGVPRRLARDAFADRLPSQVLAEKRRGRQAADWREGMTAGRTQAAAEIDRFAPCAQAAATVDGARLRSLVDSWPNGVGHDGNVALIYREGLMRGIATGHFLRRAAEQN